MRQWIILIMALFALSGSLLAGIATRHARDTQLRGYVNPVTTTHLPYRVPRLGVNATLEQYSPDELDNQLSLMVSANIHWIRQEIPWRDVEPSRGAYNWSDWDRITEAVADYDSLRLILVLRDAPAWARTPLAVDEPTAPPDDPLAFAAFAGAVASRYSETVDHYQIWDEPNLREAWGYLDPRPAEYAALLGPTYREIHRADATATVIAAALAPTTETGPHNLNEWLYLDALYALEAANSFDAVAAKPYGFASDPNDRTIDEKTLNFSRIVRLRELMVANGDGQKAIWASNWGWNSLPSSWDGPPSIWGVVTQETRVAYTLAALDRAEREWPWLAGMTLHHWQPAAPPDDPLWGFALVWQDDTQTPLLTALQGRSTPLYATNGHYPPDTPHATYHGVWTFGDLGADIGWLSDSQLSFKFVGSEVALLLRQGDFVAYLYPQINGNPANALPQDNAGNAYIVLTDPLLTNRVSPVTVAHNLPASPHTLTATADRGWDRWVLAGYAVSSGNLATPYNQQIALAWFTAAVAALAVIVSATRVKWQAVAPRVAWVTHPASRLMSLVVSLVASVVLMVGMLLSFGGGTPNLLRRDELSLILSIATAGILYLQPWIVFTVIAMIALFWVFYHRPDMGIMLTLLWSPFFLFPVQLYLYAFPMSELLLLITFGAWALRMLVTAAQHYRDGQLALRWSSLTPLDWGVTAFSVAALLSLSWTQYLDPALTELRVLIVEPILLYILMRCAVRGASAIARLVDTLLVAGLLMSLIGLSMYVLDLGIITAEGGARRLAGVYGSPNNVALFLGRVLPFALAYVILAVGRYRCWLGLSVLLVGMGTVALTQSVGALFIGVPLALLAVFVLTLRRRAVVPSIVLFLLVGVTFLILLRYPRFARVLDFSTGTNFFRLRVWESALNVIADHPLTGLGLDQFLYAFRGHYILPDAWQEPDLSHPHNFILDFWTRLGILGVFVFSGLQWGFWQRTTALYRHARQNTLQYALLIGAAGSMINLLGHGLVDNSVFVNDLALIFMFLLALPQQLVEEHK